MRKTLLLLLITLLPTAFLQAQYMRIGAKATGGFSRAKGSDAPASENVHHLAVFGAGLIFSYQFVSSLALQTELNYMQKGLTYDDEPVNQTEYMTGDVRLHYVELPVLLKVQRRGLFAEAGPYVGYLAGEGSTVERFSSASGTTPRINLGPQDFSLNDFEHWDYGYAIGAGLILDNGFFLSFRNTGGFTSFAKDLDQKNLVWQISIGFIRPGRRPGNVL